MKLFNKQFWFNNLWHGENRRENNRAEFFEGLDFHQRAAVVSIVMPDQSRIWGCDFSHWNLPPLAIRRMVDLYGMSFVIIKGCDGSVNTKFYLEHVAAAKEAGIPWGMYVWLYSSRNVSIDSQVNAWFARYNIDPPPMGIFIDAETTRYGGVVSNPNGADLRSAHDKWKAKSGKAATTYTAKYFADTYLKGFDWTREELWVANYGVTIPALPTGARGYTIHQFTSTLDGKQLDPNGNYELDGNYYYDEALFKARFGGAPDVPPVDPPPADPPPTGGTMYRGKTNQSAKIWNSIGGTQIDTVPSGATVEGDAPSGGYAFLASPARGYTKTIWLSNYDLVTTPPPVDPPTKTQTHVIDVFSDGSIEVDGNVIP